METMSVATHEMLKAREFSAFHAGAAAEVAGKPRNALDCPRLKILIRDLVCDFQSERRTAIIEAWNAGYDLKF